MKKIYLLFLLCPLLLLQSCLKDEKDIFTEPAAERMNNRIKADKEVLTGATNGWILSYYPEKNKIYGGYTLFVKFNTDNTVNVSSELSNKADSVITSYYDIIPETGPLLTFNTHNGFIHYFSDPRNPDANGTDNGGMKGDYEFIVIEATAEKVTLKGKKTGNPIIMTPVGAEVSWKNDMTEYQKAALNTSFLMMNYVVNGKNYPVSVTDRNLFITVGKELHTIPFIITPAGYNFYTPIKIDGVEVNKMDFVKANREFVDANGSGAKLIVVNPKLNEYLTKGKWYFSLANGNIGNVSKTSWAFPMAMLSINKQNLYYAYFGSIGGQLAFAFTCTTETGINAGTLFYAHSTTELPDNQIMLQFAMSGNSVGVYYHNDFYFYSILNTLGYAASKTFTITADNVNDPTWLKIVDNANVNNYYVLYKNKINYPVKN